MNMKPGFLMNRKLTRWMKKAIVALYAGLVLALAAATVVMGNIAFLLFDKTLANLLRLYRLKWQLRLRRMLGR